MYWRLRNITYRSDFVLLIYINKFENTMDILYIYIGLSHIKLNPPTNNT